MRHLTRRDAVEEMMTMPARVRSGPAPDPNSARSEKSAWVDLPAAGRLGGAPEWPLTPPSPREMVMWRRFWAKPQAIIWEREGQLEYVAIFVRQFTEAEKEKASAENRKTVRMMFADLYLTSDAMARAHIRIVAEVEPVERETEAYERRLRAVPDALG